MSVTLYGHLNPVRVIQVHVPLAIHSSAWRWRVFNFVLYGDKRCMGNDWPHNQWWSSIYNTWIFIMHVLKWAIREFLVPVLQPSLLSTQISALDTDLEGGCHFSSPSPCDWIFHLSIIQYQCSLQKEFAWEVFSPSSSLSFPDGRGQPSILAPITVLCAAEMREAVQGRVWDTPYSPWSQGTPAPAQQLYWIDYPSP